MLFQERYLQSNLFLFARRIMDETIDNDELKLSDDALSLLMDFTSSADYYRQWLLYLNDLLIAIANDDTTHCKDVVECLCAIKHIRDLMEALQKDNPNLKED